MHLGIDLGGTKIEIVGLDDSNNVQYKRRISSPRGSYQNTIDALMQLIQDAERTLATTCSVGIGIPGSISPTTGLIQNANSTWLIGHPLKRDLEAKLDRRVAMANDADCFTLSEASDGAGADKSCVFGVILGTGVGGGISINKTLLTGPNAITGEWGHNPMPTEYCQENKAPCYCGRKHCIETYLCGPAFVKQFNDVNHCEFTRVEEILSHPDIGLRKDAEHFYTQRLAAALATVVNILDPDVIVLGGGLSNMAFLYQDLQSAMLPFVFSDTFDTEIRQAHHGDSSGVRGAAWLGKATRF